VTVIIVVVVLATLDADFGVGVGWYCDAELGERGGGDLLGAIAPIDGLVNELYNLVEEFRSGCMAVKGSGARGELVHSVTDASILVN